MNFNKKLKGFFISSLSALVAVCGVAFGVTYKNAAVKAADGNGTVIDVNTLSADVKAVYDAFNDAPLISGNSNQNQYYGTYRNAYKIEYVKGAVINGVTVSGLRFSIDTNLSDKRITVIQPRLKIDTSSLSWNTPLFGFMMESRENKSATDFELGPTLIDEDGQGFRLQVYESDIANGERSAIRAYVINNDVNTGDGGTNVGGYYGQDYVYTPNIRKWIGNRFVDTFAESATQPFNFYYDNATNVAYCDASGDGSYMGWHLIRMFSEDPADYGNHNSPFPTESSKSYGTGSGEATKFLGFKNNTATLGIRLVHGDGMGKYSFILTSYAGLDLTDPGNTFAATTDNYGVQTDNRTVAVKDGSTLVGNLNGNSKLPELCYKNRITGAVMDGEIGGTIKIYGKQRSSESIEYTAYGATVDKSELGNAIDTVEHGGSYGFNEAGDYTLEYEIGDGKSVFFDYPVVELSNDVNHIINALNETSDLTNNNAYDLSAQYVNDYVYNGAKISGIKIDFSVKSGVKDSLYLPILVKISDFTYDDNILGYVITPDNVGTQEIKQFGAYIVSADKQRAIQVQQFYDNDQSGTDDPFQPRAATYVKVSNDGFLNSSKYADVGVYYYNAPQNNYGLRGYRPVSFKGYETSPFNLRYDATRNALYGTVSNKISHNSSRVEFMRAFNVDPKAYSSITDPVSGETLSNYTGSAAFKPMTGLGEYAYVGFSVKMNEGVNKGSFILTSYAGLDLTDPTATSGNVLSALDGQSIYADSVNKTLDIADVKTVNAITGADSDEAFDGTVTVYRGAREDKYVKYGSWGAETLGFPVVGGEAVNGLTYLGVAENGVYTFNEAAFYTLVYTASNGETEIKEVCVSKKLTLNLVAYNAVLKDANGNELVSGDEVYSGQTIKVVPNAGYKLLDIGTGTGGAPTIFIGNKENETINVDQKYIWGKYELLSDGAYVIKADDGDANGTLNMAIAAYNKRYTATVCRNKTEDAENYEATRTMNLYETIPASYWDGEHVWCLYKPTDFKPYVDQQCAKWYATFGWDGKVLELGNYTWKDYSVAEGDPYKNVQPFGYKITYGNGSKQQSSLYKIGGTSNPVIDSDVTLEAAFIRSFVDYKTAKIETDGTIGLSVKLGISKPDYDRLIRMVEGTDLSLDFYAVVTTGDTLDALNDGQKDAFHIKDGTTNFITQEINRNNLVTETINGKEYYVFNVKGINIPKENYAKDYVFGGYVSYKSLNGDQVVRFGQDGEEFEKINVYTAAKNTFGAGSSVINTESGSNSREINGLTYYSDTISSRGIYFAVKYYYIGSYLTYVTETETEGYMSVEVNGKTYWYSDVAPADILRAIKFYNGISLAEEA